MKQRTNRFKTKTIAAVLLISLIGGSCFAVNAQKSADNESSDTAVYNFADENAYLPYMEKNSDVKAAKEDILLSLDECTVSAESGAAIDTLTDRKGTEKEALVWNSCKGSLSWRIHVPEDASYHFEMTYLPLKGSGRDINFGLKIDGNFPFTETQRLIFPRMYKDSDEKRFDANGNQYSPEQEELSTFISKQAYDSTGVEILPFFITLSAGIHTVTLSSASEPFAIAECKLKTPEVIKSYAEVLAEYQNKGYKSANIAEPIITEGEYAFSKSTLSIIPKSDVTSPSPFPSDTKHQLINYIGGSNWKNPGEEVNWTIHVSKAGLYRLGVNYKQDQTVNGFSYRSLKIDGKTPFEEARSLEFDYNISWNYYSFADEKGEPYLFYLEEGDHTLTLTATLAETSVSYNRLKEIISNLSDLYLQITMITGETPDANRDYELFKQISGFEETLKSIKNKLDILQKELIEISGGRTTTCVSAINNMARVIGEMIDNPYTAHEYVNDYYNTYTTLGAWLYDMKSMPLCIDRFYLYPADSKEKPEYPNLLKKFVFSVSRFIFSFTEDYNTVSADDQANKALKIWVNWGRDQAMVLDSLIKESFTPKTGIAVNLELTDASLVKGILSNNAPDLSLHLPRTEPVNLAMRGVLYDLTQFEDYPEVIKRFGQSASEPYKYGDGIYALPDTQSFYIMFYRSDILKNLGISVPATWDEFLAATAVLQRNNMQSWIPYMQITASTTVNTGVGGLNLFASLLQQMGEGFYNQERNLCMLDSADALAAFTFWTDMYTKYKIPTAASFYNRFRIGTMPLGVEGYTNYTLLSEAAPEIEGRWGIALVPGVAKEDGAVDHTVSGSGTGCAIINSSDNKTHAWEFLKWWTDEDTQLRYNNNVESILGAVSRTTTATLEAFERMSWEPGDLDILLEQRNWISEIPEVPGSYYVSRAVDQSFWEVINGEAAPKDSVTYWSEIANNEIERKIRQYSARNATGKK